MKTQSDLSRPSVPHTSEAALSQEPPRTLRVRTRVKAGGRIRCPDPDSSCTTSNHSVRVRAGGSAQTGEPRRALSDDRATHETMA